MVKPKTPDMMAAKTLTLKKQKVIQEICLRTALSVINVQKLTKYYRIIYLYLYF